MNFRTLRADEIDVRIGSVGAKGVTLLLYKDARCDQNILDETVGEYNWQRHHSRDNANCTVSIWDKDKEQWIEKEDTGTESYTEKEKGIASDSFKRACFNWGIGRELYTAPFLFVSCATTSQSKGYALTPESRKKLNGIKVSEITYLKDEKKIKTVTIVDKNGELLCKAYSNDVVKNTTKEKTTAEERGSMKADDKVTAGGVDFIRNLCAEVGSKEKAVCDYFHINSFEEMKMREWEEACVMLEKKKGKKNEK